MFDRFSGTLLGLAIGDMVGAPYEGLKSYDIWDRFGEISGPLVPIITDDSEMTMAVARSIGRTGKVDPKDITGEFMRWFNRSPTTIGRTTYLALKFVKEGTPWQDAGAKVHRLLGKEAEGNGSIMRTAPIGLLGIMDEKAMMRNSAEVSRITHASPICIDSAVAVSLAVAQLAQSNPDEAVEHVIDRMQNRSKAVIDTIEGALESAEPPETLSPALTTLYVAIRAMYTKHSYKEAVLWAVGWGGDTDTQGAVAGALSGARWGRSGIPSDWLELLDSSPLKVDEIMRTSERLHDIVTRP